MWSAQKKLSNLISGVLIGKKYDLFATLQEELNKNFNNLLDILKDAPSNSAERAKVQKSNEEAIQINFLNCEKKLQPSVIEEAIALSDLFTLSELSSVELLIEAEEQMQYFHGFNRGLTAVLLYYDSKKIQMNSLKTLLLARSGRTWILDESTPAEITNFIDSFVQRLVQNGLIEKILAQIGVHEWSKAEENLVRVNGLGSLKHRKQVKNLFEEVKVLLGECVFSCACQVPLDNQSTIWVINFLKNNSQMIQSNHLDSKLNLDTSHFFLLMALFYCFDTSYLENKEHVEIDAILKSFLQNDYVHNVYNELNKADNAEWSNLGIKSSLQFAFQIFISNLNYFMIENENQSYTQLLAINISGLEEDDNLIDKSIEQHVFSFFKNTIIQHERFHCEKFVLERVHNMVTDFIYRMPEKIKDMRNRNEDLQRLVEDSYSNQSQSSFYYNAYSTQAINRQPAVAHDNHDFEDFLDMIGHLYANNTLNLELCLNYWIADSEMNASNMANNYQKPTQKQISLYKFVRYFLSGDTLIGSLYIAYVNMLTGLCTGEQSAQHCFCLLQNNSHFYDSHGPKISWMHITTAFEKYYESFRTNQTNVMLNMVQQRASSNKGITQQELKGLISVTKLVRQIALYSEKARLALCEYQRHTDTFNTSTSLTCLNENTLPMCLFGLLTCSIPNSLKGEILNLLATFALSPQIAINLWQSLENSQLIPTTAPASSSQSTSSQSSQQYFYKHDIKTELEEVESREEAYPLLKGFLSLIKNLCTMTIIPENLGLGLRAKNALLGFQPYLHFLVNQVYLKVLYRAYKQNEEKWQLTNDILEIFYQIINKYECQIEEFRCRSGGESTGSVDLSSSFQINAFKSPLSNSPGYRLLYDFIHDGPIVKMLFVILNESLNYLLEFNSKNECAIEQASLKCLKLISLILDKQRDFIEKMKVCNLNVESSGIEKLIITINLNTNRADYFMSIFRFIQFNSSSSSSSSSSSLINHAFHSLNIVYALSNYSLVNQQILNLFLKSCLSLDEQFELMHSFVEFLDLDIDEASTWTTSVEDSILNVARQGLDCVDTDSADTSFQVAVESVAAEQHQYKQEQQHYEHYEHYGHYGHYDHYDHYEQEKQRQGQGQERGEVCSWHVVVKCQSRLKALKLLLFYLRLTAPNISHLLLGFDIHKPLNSQQFYNAGTKINYRGDSNILSIVPRNCLHSVMRILSYFVRDCTLLNKVPQTIQLCYEIVFVLCSDFRFKTQIFNYLRSEFDFINLNLKRIPFKLTVACVTASTTTTTMTKQPTIKDSTNFLSDTTATTLTTTASNKRMLKTIDEQTLSDESLISLMSIYSLSLQLTCLEIQQLICTRMKQQLKKLLHILTDNTGLVVKRETSENSRTFAYNMDTFSFSGQVNPMAKFRSALLTKFDQSMSDGQDTNESSKLFYLLNFVSFNQTVPSALELNFFDPSLIENVISSCKISLAEAYQIDVHLFDLKKLKQILCNEIRSAPPTISMSKSQLINELNYIVRNVYHRNQFQLSFYYKKKYFDSFRLLVETFVQLVPNDICPLQKRYSSVYLMSKALLAKVLAHHDLLAQLTFHSSSLLFTLVVNLRKCVSQLRKMKYLSDMNMSIMGQQQSATQTNYINVINLPNLVDLFKQIIQYLLDTALTNYKVRTHLYAAILNYLMIFDVSDQPDECEYKKEIEYYENIRILLSNMNNLLKILCTDSCEGLNIVTMMGLTLLNKIIDLDLTNPKWLKYLNDNGYINCIINTIKNTDNELLEESFNSQTNNDKVFFIYETKLALFATIAKTSHGAEMLIKNGLISCLSQCSVFSLRVKFDRNIYAKRSAAYLIQLLHQFYQIFFPILNLFILILNTTGSNNIEIKTQVSKFVLAHNETFLHILTSKVGDNKMLDELKMVTCLLSKLSPFDLLKYEISCDKIGGEHDSIFSRIHREVLNLINVYLVPEQLKYLRKEIEHHSANKHNVIKQTNSSFAEIASNIVTYSTNVMKVSQQKIPLLIFSAKIESQQLHPYSPTMMQINSKYLQLGLLIDFLKYSMENLDKSIDLEAELNHKNEHVNDLLEIEKKQLVGENKMFERMGDTEKQLHLKQILKIHLKAVRNETLTYRLMIERGLLILWRHVEFYLINRDLNLPSYQLFRTDFYSMDQNLEMENKRLDRYSTDSKSREDFVKFKNDLDAVMGANFFKKCLDVDQKVQHFKHDNFVAIVSKRIQKLMHLISH